MVGMLLKKQLFFDKIINFRKNLYLNSYFKRKKWSAEIIAIQNSFLNGSISGSSRDSLTSSLACIMSALRLTARYSKVKFRRRCPITYRSRGITRIGISRGAVFKYASFGYIAGLKKV